MRLSIATSVVELSNCLGIITGNSPVSFEVELVSSLSTADGFGRNFARCTLPAVSVNAAQSPTYGHDVDLSAVVGTSFGVCLSRNCSKCKI